MIVCEEKAEMFVPQAGAMQFEFDPGWEERGRKWVWVKHLPNHRCPVGGESYEILEWHDLLLCSCHGHPIE